MAISINGITVAGIGKDGKNGVDGKDATINGVNALNIKATGGLTDQQSGDTYTIDGSGLVPKTTTVNGKPLSGNVSLVAGDVGADSAGSAASALTDAKAYADGLTAADVGAIPTVTGSAGQFLGFTSANVVGAIDAPSGGSGKRTCRFVVGTSTAGWTESDCDYLCDGTDDQVEINAAIQALPSGGGEIVILDGTYNIAATIAMNKDNVKLSGNGNATVLKRMWDSSMHEGVITITATNGGCCVENIFVDGNKSAYRSSNNCSIYLGSSSNNTITGNTCNNSGRGIYLFGSSNNTITGNTCNSNNHHGIYLDSSSNNTITGNTCNSSNYHGIHLDSSSNNTITGNTCNNSGNYGIFLYGSSNNTITGNTCNNNLYSGIRLFSSSNNTITGNTCIRGNGTSSDYTNAQYTIYLFSTKNNYNLISSNNIMGKNYVSDGGTGNTFVNNKYN